MSSYFIESFKIEKLWGYQDIDRTFIVESIISYTVL